MDRYDFKSSMLPSFFVIGPPRTGTTWLHEVLKQHTSLPHDVKETRFFDEHFDRGMEWYLRYFSRNAGTPRGEVAPTYFASHEARQRIAQTAPHAKVVCIFRHPVERAISLYRLKHAYGMVQADFEAALLRDPELLESGKYATHLKAWQKAMGHGQVLVTFYDQLRDDPQSYIDDLAGFIGLPRFMLTPSQTRFAHTSEALTKPLSFVSTRLAVGLADQLKTRHLERVVNGLKNSRVGKLFLSSGRPFARISPAALEAARELFSREVLELEQMLQVDLSAWKSAGFDNAGVSTEKPASLGSSRNPMPHLRKAELPDQAS